MIRPWNNVRCCFKDCWVLESLDFVAWSSYVSLSALWKGSQLPAQLQYYTTEETFCSLPSVAETLLLPFKKIGFFVCLFVCFTIHCPFWRMLQSLISKSGWWRTAKETAAFVSLRSVTSDSLSGHPLPTWESRIPNLLLLRSHTPIISLRKEKSSCLWNPASSMK